MEIRLWGQRNVLGGGIFYSSFTDALSLISGFGSLVKEIDLIGPNFEVEASKGSAADINVLFGPPARPVRVPGRIVKWAVFEADRVDDKYLSYLSKSDLIWTPSNWAKNVLVDNGLASSQIDVVPEGVDSSIFHPFLRDSMARDNAFRFFMCGKYELRKGYPEILEGFARAFGNHPDVRLYLKSDNFYADIVGGEDKNAELRADLSQRNLNNVQLVTGQYSSSDLSMINSFMDAQVFPSRAEGWGLPLLEGIACSLPTTCNFYSGQTEYLSSVKPLVRLLDYEMTEVTDPGAIGQFAEGTSWAISSADSIAEALMDLYENKEEWSVKALQASDLVRKKFTWESSAFKAINSLVDKGLLKPEWSLGI